MNLHARDKLRSITNFESLVEYLRDELDWPIDEADFEELTFEYEPEELGIDEKNAAKIEKTWQLRPLTTTQPWGIFFVEFERKRLPVVALRRILSRLVLKKRTRAEFAEQASWKMNDLLFILNYGDQQERQINFAHFSESPETGDLPALKVLGWDESDTPLHLDHVDSELHSKLRWPEKTVDVETWRETWSAAFTLKHREVITTSKKLAVELANIARRIRRRVNAVLEIEDEKGPVRKLMAAFKEALIHDLSDDDFADMYAQTIAYGLLSARVSRPAGLVADNVVDMVPITNPFLKELLQTFLGLSGRKKFLDFDELGINEVVELLRQANMEAVLRDFGDANPQEDPVIHFYELFLKEYDAKKRMQRGVFYTPRPVVSFIVRSVDEILRTEFGLADGLADTATWGDMAQRHKDLQIPKGTDPNECFVQILDPATGTGTFLVEVIDLIYKTMTAKWQKQGKTEAEIQQLWNAYVPKYLLPRLYGYELLMAPYAIAHMKIGLKLYETGYRFGSHERVRVYLTNALEPAQDFSDRLAFAVPPLAHEAEAVNEIKRVSCFTVIIGNPPYSGHSANKGSWISNLVNDYYYVDGKPLGEKNTKWLQDDYVKFIRFGQYCIESTGIGVHSFITNHGYVDNPTFRGMRQRLIRTFSSLKILDLHGNTNKKEKSPDGTADQNVFDIQQGVAVFVASLSPNNSQHHNHANLYGKRNKKYSILSGNSMFTLEMTQVVPVPPFYFVMPQDTVLRREYDKGTAVTSIFPKTLLGPNSHRDSFAIAFDYCNAVERIRDLADASISDSTLRKRYGLVDNRDWSLTKARQWDFRNEVPIQCLYRPFDFRWMLYGPYAFDYHRPEINDHLLQGKNVALISTRQTKEVFSALVTKHPAGQHKIATPYDGSYLSPLYLYEKQDRLQLSPLKSLNLAPSFMRKLRDHLEHARDSDLTPETIFAYTYAILYCPTYRTRYAEFLKIDFPRIPLTSSLELFRALAKLGGELVSLHLMESPKLDNFITTLVGSGEFRVEKVSYSDQTVWLDKAKTYGFRGVPEEVWNFHIGGYQVCEKWLKDRQARGGKKPRPGRVLTPEDLAHYQKIVVALKETIRLMQEIDEVIEQHGGWPGAFVTGEKKESADEV